MSDSELIEVYREDDSLYSQIKDNKNIFYFSDGETIAFITDYRANIDASEEEIADKYYTPDGKVVEPVTTKDGDIIQYCLDGKTPIFKKGHDGSFILYNWADKEGFNFIRDKDGNELVYRDDGKTLDFAFDAKQKIETHYAKDGKTIAYTSNDQDERTYYRADGSIIKPVVDKNGTTIQYAEDEKTKVWEIDKNNHLTYYEPDGEHILYQEDDIKPQDLKPDTNNGIVPIPQPFDLQKKALNQQLKMDLKASRTISDAETTRKTQALKETTKQKEKNKAPDLDKKATRMPSTSTERA